MSTARSREEGVALPTALLAMLILLMLGGLFVTYGVGEQRATASDPVVRDGAARGRDRRGGRDRGARRPGPAQPALRRRRRARPTTSRVRARGRSTTPSLGSRAGCTNFERTAGGDGIAIVDDDAAGRLRRRLPARAANSGRRRGSCVWPFDARPTTPFPATVTILTGVATSTSTATPGSRGGLHANGDVIGGPHQASGGVTRGRQPARSAHSSLRRRRRGTDHPELHGAVLLGGPQRAAGEPEQRPLLRAVPGRQGADQLDARSPVTATEVAVAAPVVGVPHQLHLPAVDIANATGDRRGCGTRTTGRPTASTTRTGRTSSATTTPAWAPRAASPSWRRPTAARSPPTARTAAASRSRPTRSSSPPGPVSAWSRTSTCVIDKNISGLRIHHADLRPRAVPVPPERTERPHLLRRVRRRVHEPRLRRRRPVLRDEREPRSRRTTARSIRRGSPRTPIFEAPGDGRSDHAEPRHQRRRRLGGAVTG